MNTKPNPIRIKDPKQHTIKMPCLCEFRFHDACGHIEWQILRSTTQDNPWNPIQRPTARARIPHNHTFCKRLEDALHHKLRYLSAGGSHKDMPPACPDSGRPHCQDEVQRTRFIDGACHSCKKVVALSERNNSIASEGDLVRRREI
jgi:hypothetical protein